MRQKLRRADRSNVDCQAQPDCSGLGQLSSLCLLAERLLESGPGHPLSTAQVGQADPSEQILRLAETEILQLRRTLRVLRSQAYQHGRKPSAALAFAQPHVDTTPYQGPRRGKPLRPRLHRVF